MFKDINIFAANTNDLFVKYCSSVCKYGPILHSKHCTQQYTIHYLKL